MKLVLAGGGYAHLLLLRDWHKTQLPAAKLTLVSPFTHLPYSGMLPGCIAGQYTPDDIMIDVQQLCEHAGAKLILDEVCGVDPIQNRVLLSSQKNLNYDLLSLNTGPAAEISIPGVAEHAIAVKPISRFLPLWETTCAKLRATDQVLQLVMVGGGAGSVETVLAMAQAVIRDAAMRYKPRITLLCAATRLLPDYPARVAKHALQRCQQLGITVQCGKRVSCVTDSVLEMQASSKEQIAFDILFWCAQAAAPAWLLESGLPCDAAGFLKVTPALQSPGDPAVFATGDIAAFVARALPKAGVFAVQQAPILRHNLINSLNHQPLLSFQPATRFLSLLNLGAEFATGSYGPLAFSGHWVRRWKERIDRKFINSFKNSGTKKPLD